MRPSIGLALAAFFTSAALVFSCAVTDDTTSAASATATGVGGAASSTGSGGTGGSGGALVDKSADCKTLELPVAAFEEATAPGAVGAIAGDFTVETLDGPWNFASEFSGCDNYVFINYFKSAPGDQIWSSDLAKLFAGSALNVHYFFGSYTSDEQARTADINAIKERVEMAFFAMDPALEEWWRKRVHYVTSRTTEVTGSVGEYYAGFFPSVIFAMGIGRDQRFDPAGSLGRLAGATFVYDTQMAAPLSHYYNFVYDRDRAAAEETVTDVVLIDNQLITKNNDVYEAEFPDKATMAGFDTMEIDITASCGPGPTDCGEWDYEAYLELCQDAECSDRDQIGLWITPYARPGTRRWIVDATPFMGFLGDGGKRSFRFGMLWNMNPNTMRVSFRLSNRGIGVRPVQAIPLFEGGAFNAEYNSKYSPIEITPPATTKKVELVALISGHGQDAGNCAEWCNHAHTFTVNGTATHTKDHPGEAGDPLGCALRANEGVVPGQYGNWAPSRAAWCPGLEVKPWRVDITNDITMGATNSMSYAGSFNGKDPVGGRIRMSSFVVFYE